jgi:hypothetical protein
MNSENIDLLLNGLKLAGLLITAATGILGACLSPRHGKNSGLNLVLTLPDMWEQQSAV